MYGVGIKGVRIKWSEFRGQGKIDRGVQSNCIVRINFTLDPDVSYLIAAGLWETMK